MRVLLIEDQPAVVSALSSELGGDDVQIVHGATRDEALDLLQQGFFDVAICDLKIPSVAGSVSDIEHGLAALMAIREQSAGTPIITFTAYKTMDVLDRLLREQNRGDFLGTMDELPMLVVMEKDELPELVARVNSLRDEFARLEGIEVASGLGQAPLDWEVARVVRVYSRQRNCVLARVTPLAGGRSGIPVIRLKMERGDGSRGGSAVGRIGPLESVNRERIRFQQFVSGVLPFGSYAEIVGVITAGAGPTGAVFYQIAENAEPLLLLPIRDDGQAAAIVNVLRNAHGRWSQGAPAETLELRDIRRLLVDDGRWADVAHRCGLSALDVVGLEAAEIHIRRCTVHADLHGGNVLVGNDPVLIDFASVTSGPTPLDPVSLELSLLFHPDVPPWPGTWPSADQLEAWADIDAYLVGCPFPFYVRACREWALDVARGDRDVVACAYAYVAAQARFPTSDDENLAALTAGFRAYLT